MIKLLLIIVLAVYLISRLGRFLMFFNTPSRSFGNPPTRPQAQSPPTSGRKGTVKGGEYVDFEEIK